MFKQTKEELKDMNHLLYKVIPEKDSHIVLYPRNDNYVNVHADTH